VSVSGTTLIYDAALGEANSVAINCAPTECVVADPSAAITAGPGCLSNGTESRCAAAGVTAIQVALRDGDDFASQDPSATSQLPLTADGGDGADTINGGAGGDTLIGGEGSDQLLGLGESDLVAGGIQDDFVKGGTGEDSLRGGCGNDRLYGEEDDDTITGNDASAPGQITVCRGSGGDPQSDNDYLRGDLGDDRLFDSAGRNRFYGDDGNDTVNGVVDTKPKSAAVTGGIGRDRLIVSGSGLVRAKDGFKDRVVCSGADLNVSFDKTLDKVGGSCPAARGR
jgi:Ca2+-binding RTX toxin-like protein